MAGKVARYPTTQLRNADYVRQDFGRNMEENDVLSHLNDKSFDKRADILEQLRSMVRRNGGRLPFANQRNIFKGLVSALKDSNWDVRIKCIQLVHELIPFLNDDLDDCMVLLLPHLIPNLGDSKIAVRRAVIQTIHVYMKYTTDVQQILKAIVRYGLESPDAKIKKEVTVALPMLFTPEFSQENFYEIAQSLAKRLLECSSVEDGESLQQHALLSLNKIQSLVGNKAFKEYLDKLSPPLRKYYNKLNHDEPEPAPSFASRSEGSLHHGANGLDTPARRSTSYQSVAAPSSYYSDSTSGRNDYEFGVVPSHIMDKLNDQSNYRARAQAVEELKLIIRDLQDIRPMEPHLLHFISFLNNLLDDSNFKITTATLEILGLLVEKLNVSVKPHLKPMVLALTKRMGDNKVVIRQLIMRVIVKQLMHILSPKPVLSVVCENLSHKNSRVRQETLNIVIASLLTFPSYDFDLGYLCQTIAHTLIDQKRQVRQAALESFAVLAQAMGAGKLQPLVQAVDSVELSYDGDGVMGAVQARLARRQLPKLNADSLVDYATPIPLSAGSRGGGGKTSGGSVNLPPGADIEWILQAPSGTGSSARSDRSELEITSVNSSARSTPNNFTQDYSGSGSTRRHINSGKSRLPWDAENVEPAANGATSNRVGGKPPATWPPQHDSSPEHHQPKAAPKIKGHLGQQQPHDQDAGSYRKAFLDNKFKRQSSDSIAQPFTVYNPNSDEGGRGGGYSFAHTPRGGAQDNPNPNPNRFSQSWPEPRMFEEAGMPNKRLLVPITGDPYTAAPDWTEEERGKKDAPIPTKPTLVRSNSSRGNGSGSSSGSGGQGSSKRKVPPIPVSTSMVVDRTDPEVGYVDHLLDTARDSAYNDIMDDLHDPYDDEDKVEMVNSLHSIRNSASKKKVSKLFSAAAASSPSPTDPLGESGIFSHTDSMSPSSTAATTPKTKKGHPLYGELKLDRNMKRCYENYDTGDYPTPPPAKKPTKAHFHPPTPEINLGYSGYFGPAPYKYKKPPWAFSSPTQKPTLNDAPLKRGSNVKVTRVPPLVITGQTALSGAAKTTPSPASKKQGSAKSKTLPSLRTMRDTMRDALKDRNSRYRLPMLPRPSDPGYYNYSYYTHSDYPGPKPKVPTEGDPQLCRYPQEGFRRLYSPGFYQGAHTGLHTIQQPVFLQVHKPVMQQDIRAKDEATLVSSADFLPPIQSPLASFTKFSPLPLDVVVHTLQEKTKRGNADNSRYIYVEPGKDAVSKKPLKEGNSTLPKLPPVIHRQQQQNSYAEAWRKSKPTAKPFTNKAANFTINNANEKESRSSKSLVEATESANELTEGTSSSSGTVSDTSTGFPVPPSKPAWVETPLTTTSSVPLAPKLMKKIAKNRNNIKAMLDIDGCNSSVDLSSCYAPYVRTKRLKKLKRGERRRRRDGDSSCDEYSEDEMTPEQVKKDCISIVDLIKKRVAYEEKRQKEKREEVIRCRKIEEANAEAKRREVARLRKFAEDRAIEEVREVNEMAAIEEVKIMEEKEQESASGATNVPCTAFSLSNNSKEFSETSVTSKASGGTERKNHIESNIHSQNVSEEKGRKDNTFIENSLSKRSTNALESNQKSKASSDIAVKLVKQRSKPRTQKKSSLNQNDELKKSICCHHARKKEKVLQNITVNVVSKQKNSGEGYCAEKAAKTLDAHVVQRPQRKEVECPSKCSMEFRGVSSDPQSSQTKKPAFQQEMIVEQRSLQEMFATVYSHISDNLSVSPSELSTQYTDISQQAGRTSIFTNMAIDSGSSCTDAESSQISLLGNKDEGTGQDGDIGASSTDISKGEQAPFMTRAQMARKTAPHGRDEPDNRSGLHSSVSDPSFEPLRGVTFKSNPSSDVAVIGKGYMDDQNSLMDAPKPTPLAHKAKKRPAKGVVALSPLGVASQFSVGHQPQDPDDLPPNAISLEGRGMFDSSGQGGYSDIAAGRRISRADPSMGGAAGGGPGGKPLKGVYGRRVQQPQSTDDDSDDSDQPPESEEDDDDEEDDEDVSGMSMSQSARDHISIRVRQMEEEKAAEQRKKQQQEAAKARREQERQQQQRKLKEQQQQRISRTTASDSGTSDQSEMEGLAISGSGGSNNSTSSPAVIKRSPPNRKHTPAKVSKARILTEGQSKCEHGLVSGEPMSMDDLEPYSDPNAALSAALSSIAKDDWCDKCDGLCGIRRLVRHHSDQVCKDLPAVVMAVTAEVKNLRSSVCRMAAICLGEMCIILKKRMDPHVDKMTKLLLNKTGENAAKFLMADAEEALYRLVEHCSPPRVLIAFSSHVGHKNVLVRKSTSTMMSHMAEKLGPAKVLTGQKDLTDKILSGAAQFIQDSAPETRWNGQKIFYMLMDDPRFEGQFNKSVPENTRNNIKDKLETLRRKGLPDNPNDHSSARLRRLDGRSNSSTRGNSATSDTTTIKSQPRSGHVRTDESTSEEIKAFCDQMAAGDFRERSKAITRFQQLVERNPNAACNNLTKIFDKFVPCLRDSNSKVNLLALNTLHTVLPSISHHMSSVIALTIDTVSINLASKNRDIHDAATGVLDSFLDHIDAVVLLQPFVAVAQGGNVRCKPDIIERVAYLVTQVYSDKPKLIRIHALPLLWSLLGMSSSSGAVQGGTTSMRAATTNLAQTLYSLMHDELFNVANSTTSVTPRMTQMLKDMIDDAH